MSMENNIRGLTNYPCPRCGKQLQTHVPMTGSFDSMVTCDKCQNQHFKLVHPATVTVRFKDRGEFKERQFKIIKVEPIDEKETSANEDDGEYSMKISGTIEIDETSLAPLDESKHKAFEVALQEAVQQAFDDVMDQFGLDGQEYHSVLVDSIEFKA